MKTCFGIFCICLIVLITYTLACTKSSEPSVSTRAYKHEYKTVSKELSRKLTEIDRSVGQINAINKWSKQQIVGMSNSTEGGEITFFYLKEQLKKIECINYGETFQSSDTYYFEEGMLAFIEEKNTIYNRPIYHDSARMKEIGDTEVFQIEKSKVFLTQNYFEKEILLHQTNRDSRKIISSRNNMKTEQRRLLLMLKDVLLELNHSL